MAGLAKFLEGGAFGILNDILSTFHSEDGYAIPNRFEVIITPPRNMVAFNAKEVSLRVEEVMLPGRNLNSKTDTLTYGPTREIVDGVTYAEDITMAFQASSGLDERILFERWQEMAFDNLTWNVKYYEDYTSDIEIYLLDRQDQRRYGIKLIEAFPKTIGPTSLGQGMNNEIVKTSVTFSFRYWETADINRQPQSLGGKMFDTVVNTIERKIDANIPSVFRLF